MKQYTDFDLENLKVDVTLPTQIVISINNKRIMMVEHYDDAGRLDKDAVIQLVGTTIMNLWQQTRDRHREGGRF
jgi:hypothetical protein